MRTSHKKTHTYIPAWLGNGWFRFFAVVILLGGLAIWSVRAGLWTAGAYQLEAARARLEKAQAEFRANPSRETGADVQNAMRVYRTALGVVPAGSVQSAPIPVEFRAAGFGISSKLGEVKSQPPSPSASKIGNIKKNAENELPIRNRVENHPGSSDPVKQANITAGQKLITAPLQNFEALDADAFQTVFGFRTVPPDTNADVGPTQIVETVNSMLRVYDKTGGALTATAPLSALFGALGAPFNDLNDGNDGDPVVLYDPLADRWLISQFEIVDIAGNGRNQSYELITISTSGDAAGSYFLYAFPMPIGRINDYPHFGVWPDAYYMTDNGFNTSFTAFLGGGVYAFNRAKMLAGDATANYVFFNLPTSGGMLPTDIDGVVTPPPGTPNLISEFRADEFGDPTDALRIFEFRPNFASPAASTLTQLPDVPVAAFDARTPLFDSPIDQPSPGENLDALNDRLMHRQAFRVLPGGVQSIVLNFTVNVSGENPTSSATYQAGVRWTELRRNAATGAITINNQSTYAPGPVNGATGRNVWMASVAQDAEGNIGLTANASSTSLNPTVIYTGRLAADPANTLPQGEVDALSAVPKGIQLSNSFNRWGDYSSLSVDPADECTFWAAMEYADTPSAAFDWNTRIFSFKVNPACVSPAKATIQGQATNLSLGGAPIPDVSVTTPEGFFRSTNAAGNYSFANGVAPGTYTVTCSKRGFLPVSGSVTVAAGGTATFNCAMQGVPLINLAGSTTTAEDCSADGKADPGETISVQLCLNNTGGANAGNLVATLATTGGVTNPSAPQNYGAVATGGPAVCRTFTFRVNPAQACGANTVATFTLTDGATNLGTINIPFSSGTALISLSENFDGVTAPALPANWTATNALGPAPLWVTSTTSPNSTPNALFVNDPDTHSDKTITSPAINITSVSAQLSFRHTFSLESGFDGGVVEASINGGAFTDVIGGAVGGSFVAGTQGYTDTISNSFGSPIGGRTAFSGVNPGGFGTYVTTTVQFGAALQGKSVRFRWRMASDESVGDVGWRVDDVRVLGDLACCVKITPTASLTDPLTCTGPGNNVAGQVRVSNPMAAPLGNGNVTVALPPGLIGVNGCTSTINNVSAGTCNVTPTAITWQGTLPGNSTLVINYLVQAGDVPPSTTLCVNVTGSFPVVNVVPVQACVTVNCPAAGPGGLIPTRTADGRAIPGSDQKPGSVLIYPVYSSGSDPIRENTRIALTNIHPQLSAFVHLYFVDGSTCTVADAFVCLTANQTTTLLASDLDPGVTGYLVAMAVNRDGCPINFNYLIGDEFAKFQSGHAGNLAASAVPAIAGSFTACPVATGTVRFDGVAYAPLPRTVALDNLPSRADGNDTLLVLNRIGGNLLGSADKLDNLFGILYNDTELSLSFTLRPATCQFRTSLSNNVPRTTPRFEQFIPAGRSGWMKIYSQDDIALNGAAFNFNANANANAGAFNGGHQLHTLTTTTSASLVVPVLPVSCQ
ncbi:MAG TPA: carboxypeptidase regulatory-like domain-containing protein [Blastocatellia bacterium]|nr:carboxypeptidase regulatory-like domain-containing protein [Blastocatellia bacterium]